MAGESIRINARLTGEDARLFEELQAQKGSATQVIRAAIREYHARSIKPRKNAYTLMLKSGFVGGGEGPVDLSSRYKEQLSKSLDEQYAKTQRKSAARKTPR